MSCFLIYSVWKNHQIRALRIIYFSKSRGINFKNNWSKGGVFPEVTRCREAHQACKIKMVEMFTMSGTLKIRKNSTKWDNCFKSVGEVEKSP